MHFKFETMIKCSKKFCIQGLCHEELLESTKNKVTLLVRDEDGKLKDVKMCLLSRAAATNDTSTVSHLLDKADNNANGWVDLTDFLKILEAHGVEVSVTVS